MIWMRKSLKGYKLEINIREEVFDEYLLKRE
jgi:hypothetical protein